MIIFYYYYYLARRNLIIKFPNQVNALLTLSNGLVATAGFTATVISLWNVTTGKIQKTLIGPTDNIWGLSETKSALLLSTYVDHSSRIWNMQILN